MRGGDGGWLAGAQDPRGDPQCAVSGGRAKGFYLQDEFDFLPAQCRQIYIHREGLAVINLTDAPQVGDWATADLGIEAEHHQARTGAAFAANGGLEVVAGLDFEGWVGAEDIAILGILWDSQQAWQGGNGAIFLGWVGEIQDKALCVSVVTGAGQDARAAQPGRSAGVG